MTDIQVSINSVHEIPLAYDKVLRECESRMDPAYYYNLHISLTDIYVYKRDPYDDTEYTCNFKVEGLEEYEQ